MPTGWKNWAALVARIIVGGVFIYAGAIKIIDVPGFAKNIYQYQLLPDVWVNINAMILPWLEVFTGAALMVLPRLRQGAAAWIGLMLIVFNIAIISSLMRGLDISCGCFSTDPAAAKLGWRKVIENILLLGMTLFAFCTGRKKSAR